MNKNFHVIKDAVLKMGGTVDNFIPERNCFFVNVLGKRILLQDKVIIVREPFVSAELTKSKDITCKLLLENDVYSPKMICIYRKSYNKVEVIKKLGNLKYPIILKNAVGSNSKGIFPNIKDAKTAIKIFEKNLPRYQCIIAQEMAFGKEYRILVLDKKVIGALEMVHPYIIGDGMSTIKSLIKQKQFTTEKQTKFDKDLKDFLKSQNVSLETILPKKKSICFKNNSCLAEGGETRNVTDLVHKDIEKICVKASKVVGKYLVGIDVMCTNISKKPTKKSFNILEINGKPDLYIHYDPTHGKTRNVVKDIIKFLAKVSALSPSVIKK